MTANETAKIIYLISAAYPKYSKQIQDNLQTMVEIWAAVFSDIPYEVATTALHKLVLKSPYPPSIHDLRQEIVSITAGENADASEAWGEVTKAIKNFGSYREKEAVDSMSELTQKVVKAIGWREICLSEEPGVVRGQFIKLYNQLKEREEKEALIPQNVRERIEFLKNTVQELSNNKNIQKLSEPEKLIEPE